MTRVNRRKSGFGETPQSSYDPKPDTHPASPATRDRVKLGDGGRFVIPAAMREEMDVKPGDTLVLELQDGELRVLGRAAIMARVKRVQEMFRETVPEDYSVVDEFLAERREEARREDQRFERLHREGMALKEGKA